MPIHFIDIKDNKLMVAPHQQQERDIASSHRARIRRQLTSLSRSANSLRRQFHSMRTVRDGSIVGGHASPFPSGSALRRRHSIRENRSIKRALRRDTGTSGEAALPFAIVANDGGEFDSMHSMQNMLLNDSSVYCSVRSDNVNVLLCFNDTTQRGPDPSFVLTKLLVKTPAQGFTSPVKSGLLFVSMDVMDPLDTIAFDSITPDEWREYQDLQSKLYDSNSISPRLSQMLKAPISPISYFDIGKEQHTISVEISPPRSGKFVLVKLVSATNVYSVFDDVPIPPPPPIRAAPDLDEEEEEQDQEDDTDDMPALHPWLTPWINAISATEGGLSPAQQRQVAREAARFLPDAYAAGLASRGSSFDRNIDVQYVGLYGYTGPRSFGEYEMR